MSDVDAFVPRGTIVTTEELDHVISKMYKAKADYDAKKVVSTEAFHHLENCKAEVGELLRKAGKTEYVVEGVGKATVVDKFKVRVPSNPENRKLLFDWLKENLGDEGFYAHATVNYQTLQRLHNDAIETAEDPAGFELPGVGPAESFQELRFRKS